MQERSYTLPMCSVDHSSYIPSTITNHTVDSQLSTTTNSHDIETTNESSTSTSTPELNLLLVNIF